MEKQRKLLEDIFEHIEYKEFTIITGARQVGKTTLMKQVYFNLKAQQKDVWMLSFENQEVLSQINANPDNLFRFTSKPQEIMSGLIEKKVYILVDEIQYAENPTRFLKYLYDTYAPNLKIVATGSSAFYMDKKFKDSLAGRKKIFTLSTLSFEEFLLFKDKQHLIDELRIIRARADYISLFNNEIMQFLEEYVTYGGYPSVVLFKKIKDKIDMLKEIKNSYIKKDIDESNVENTDAFYNLLIILASQTGALLNKSELSKILRIQAKTLEKYIEVLQKSFHIGLVMPFYKNLQKEIIKMPKTYFNDLGLRNVLINNFSDIHIRTDKGELIENYVYIRLKEIYEHENLRFWRTIDKNEVDFVVNLPESGMKAYEVKYNPASISYSKYSKFNEAYPEANLEYLCYLYDTEMSVKHLLKL